MSKMAALDFVSRHPEFFRKPTIWFKENWHIVEAFSRKTLEQIHHGASHCSARETIYFLSMHTGAREVEGSYKIGNDNGADLARIFSVLFPHHAHIWEQRRPDSVSFMAAVERECAEVV